MRQRLPRTRKGTTSKLTVADVILYVTVNTNPEGKPCEMFIKSNKGWQGWCDILAETASLYLQSGGDLDELCRHWRGHRFDPQQIGVGTSLPDAIARRLMANAPHEPAMEKGLHS
jgi:hypothetical protein